MTGKKRKHEAIANKLLSGSLNRFEAEKHGDHCLNTTVSDLRKRGFEIESRWERVLTRFGNEVSVKRYWITSAPKHWQPESNR